MPGVDLINYDDDLINPHNGLGWADLEGAMYPKVTGAGSPTLTTFRGNTRWYAYAAGEDMDCVYHIPHTWAPGTDLYLHLHWAHNGTDISGTSEINYYVSYGKGHNQAAMSNPINITQTISNLSITNTPQYQMRIDEFKLTAPGGSATMLDTDQIEVDGLILINLDWTTIPTITGGAAKPFGFYLDLHYQVDRVATRRRAPNFYDR